MIINVHAGHNPDGRAACGAIGIIRESTEARRVKDAVIRGLQQLGHIVYDCTCENGTSVSNVLGKIVSKCNSHSVDLDVSIHFNSGARDAAGNGRTTGTEVLVYSLTAGAVNYARQICEAVSTLGYENRGVKARPDLSVLRNTKAPALLVECCFVDDKDDVQLYDCQKMADAIIYGITGQRVESVRDSDSDQNVEAPGETPTGDKKKLYRVQVGAYSAADNAAATQAKLKAAGFDAIVVSA